MKSHDSEGPRPDLGVRSRLLPLELREEFYVETANEEEVVSLLRPEVVRFLAAAAPAIHDSFGCDARLMIAALWRLKEPIGPVLRLFIYTKMDSDQSIQALARLRSSWLEKQPDVGLKLVVTRI